MATKKQLAALAKARKARMAKMKRKPPVTKSLTGRIPKRKTPASKRIKMNPAKKVPRTDYVVVVTTAKGAGYLSDFSVSGPKFDTDDKKGLRFSGHRLATYMQNAIYNLAQTRKLAGIKSVDIKLVSGLKKN